MVKAGRDILGEKFWTGAVPQGGQVLTQPATWVNPADGASWVFVANNSGIAGLKLVVDANGAPSLQAVWHQSPGGTSPIIANGVLYYATSGSIRALDPVSGGGALWQGAIGGIHWESPIVANGMVYVTDENGEADGVWTSGSFDGYSNSDEHGLALKNADAPPNCLADPDTHRDGHADRHVSLSEHGARGSSGELLATGRKQRDRRARPDQSS